MTFLYNANRPTEVGATFVPTGDIWSLYRHVCNPPDPGVPPSPSPAECGGSERLVWDAMSTNQPATLLRGVQQGIEAKFAGSLATITRLISLGNSHGVAADTTAPP